MKNELMIGDWVVYNGDVDYINPIRIEGMDIATGMCVTSDRDDVGFDGVWPIPLTAEILEKNFVKFGTQKYVIYGGNSYIKDMTNFFELHINFVDFRLEQQIFYVHKLQQALRLCGIEKEIEL